MKKLMAAALLAALLLVMNGAGAQGDAASVTDMKALQRVVQSDKQGYIASTLKLTDVEARKFWPLYFAYQRELDASNRRRVLVVERLIAPDVTTVSSGSIVGILLCPL